MSQGGTYDLDEVVDLDATFIQAPTTVICKVLKPDGTQVSPDPTVDPALAPTYKTSVIGDQEGTWSYRFEGTGAFTGIEEGYFTIQRSAVLGGAPNYSYDPSTSIGRLRLYIDDRDLTRVGNNVPMEQRSAIWSDIELGVFLSKNDDDAYYASAEALTVLSVNRQLLVQSRRIESTTVDYGSIRADLLKQAEAMRALGDAANAGNPYLPADGLAEQSWTNWNAERIALNAIQRGGR